MSRISAPGHERLYDNWEQFVANRGGSRQAIVPLADGYEDDLGLFCPGESEARGRVRARLFYSRDTGDVYAVENPLDVGSPVALLGSVGWGQDEYEVVEWIGADRSGVPSLRLSTVLARVATFVNEPRLCDTYEEFNQWRGIHEDDAEMLPGEHRADVYDDVASPPGSPVQVYYEPDSGELYAHDLSADGGYVLLGGIAPGRKAEFFEWLGPVEGKPLSWFVAGLEVFGGTPPALPICRQDEKHYWMSELSSTGGEYVQAGITEGECGPSVREICLRCGYSRDTSVTGVGYDGRRKAVLPVAIAMGPKIVVTGGPGAKMTPNPRATILRLVTELFPERAIVTLGDEDVSDLNCPNCDLWVGDRDNHEIAHVSTTHRSGDEWTCEKVDV